MLTNRTLDANIKCMFLKVIDTLLDIVYPLRCALCGLLLIDKNCECPICKSCFETIKFNLPQFCWKCGLGLQVENQRGCPVCKKHNFHFDRAWSACIYEEHIKRLIHLFKYSSKLKLRKLFAPILIRFIEDYHLPIKDYDLLLPVPMHAARLREREANHAEILAKELEIHFNIPLSCDELIRIRNNTPQVNLKAEKRINNVKGIFRIKDKEKFKNKNILVIDDVFTTGSTISEIAYVLKSETKVSRVDALTLARTRY